MAGARALEPAKFGGWKRMKVVSVEAPGGGAMWLSLDLVNAYERYERFNKTRQRPFMTLQEWVSALGF